MVVYWICIGIMVCALAAMLAVNLIKRTKR